MKKQVIPSNLTLLDYFAGQALLGQNARQPHSRNIPDNLPLGLGHNLTDLSMACYEQAAAMLKAREKFMESFTEEL